MRAIGYNLGICGTLREINYLAERTENKSIPNSPNLMSLIPDSNNLFYADLWARLLFSAA
jgi:hypothetical protein